MSAALEAQHGHCSGLLLPTQKQIMNAVLGAPLSSEEPYSLWLQALQVHQQQDWVSQSTGWHWVNQNPNQSDAQASCTAAVGQAILGPRHGEVQITGFCCRC